MSEHGKKKGTVHDIPIPGIQYVKGGATAFRERAVGIGDPESEDFIEDAVKRAEVAMDMGEAYDRFKSVLEKEVTKGFDEVDASYFQDLDTHLRTKFDSRSPKTKMKGKVAEKYLGKMLQEIVFPAAFGGTTDKDPHQLIADFTNYATIAHGSQQKAAQTVGMVKKLITEGKTMEAYQQIENVMKNYIFTTYSQEALGSLVPEDDLDVHKAVTNNLVSRFSDAYKGKRTIDDGYVLPKVKQLFTQYHTDKAGFLRDLHEDGEEHKDDKHQAHATGGHGGGHSA
jgi:hypothetical protein